MKKKGKRRGEKPILRIIDFETAGARTEVGKTGTKERRLSDRVLFQHAPVSLWEEDFSAVKEHIDRLRKKGFHDLRVYLSKRPEEVLTLASKVKILTVNKATLDLYGATSLDDLKEGLNLVFSKKSYDVFKDEIIALSQGQTEFCSEAVNVTLGGEEKRIIVRCTVPPGHKKDLSKVIVAITDVTSLKRREEELIASEEKYRSIFHDMKIPMLVADIETGIIIDANKEAEQLFGVSSEYLIGRHQHEVHPKVQAEHYRELFGKHAKMGGTMSDACSICTGSGIDVPVSIKSSLVRSGGHTCLVGLFFENRESISEKTVVSEGKSEALLPAGKDELSKREREILCWIAGGLSNRQIGVKLCISEKTVESHRAGIMRKLHIHKIADLVRYAMVSGLLDRSP